MSQGPEEVTIRLAADERVARVLKQCSRQSGAVRGCDLFAAVAAAGDRPIIELLAACVADGRTLESICGRIEASQPAPTEITAATEADVRLEFAPSAAGALFDFEGVTADAGARADGVLLELLLGCVLSHLDEADRRLLAGVNVEQALAQLRSRVSAAMQAQPAAGKSRADDPDLADDPNGPFVLPAEIAPSEDLTWRARQADAAGEFPFDGDPRFEGAFEAVSRALHRGNGNHVLLVGERGVGKGTILAELARRAAAGQFPFLADKRFVSVNCRFTAPEESRQRLLKILSQAADRPDVILCLDPLADLLRYAAGHNKLVLLSALARAQCRVIGLGTPRDYEEFAAGDLEFLEFFHRVDVEEPDVPVATKLLAHFARGLEAKYQVTIHDEAVRQSVVLSANYILNDQLPAKALRLLSRVCQNLDYDRTQLGRSCGEVTPDDVIQAVSETTGVPAETLRGIAERSDYEQSLKELIFGQDHVVKEVAAELGLIKAGMTEVTKPASVMLFIGQTGTGKTEMAKALARFYSTSKRLRVYTLGNFVESHSVAGIIGVPPGYVGTDQGGRLVNELNADPYGVFLLDEVDKAHPDVLQPFLNLFDEGWIVDQRGTKAFGNRAIFILTTNVGQRMISEMAKRGESLEAITTKMKETLTQIKHTKSNRPVFSPEFLARIKRIIVFRPLESEAMEKISLRLVGDLQREWSEKRGKRLEIDRGLATAVAELAHTRNEKSQGREGGRIVRKLLADVVETALQREVSLRPADYQRAAGAIVSLRERPGGENGQAAGDGLAERVEVRFLDTWPAEAETS